MCTRARVRHLREYVFQFTLFFFVPISYSSSCQRSPFFTYFSFFSLFELWPLAKNFNSPAMRIHLFGRSRAVISSVVDCFNFMLFYLDGVRRFDLVDCCHKMIHRSRKIWIGTTSTCRQFTILCFFNLFFVTFFASNYFLSLRNEQN